MMYIHVCSYLLGFIITNNSFLIILDVFQKMKETHKLAWSFPNHIFYFLFVASVDQQPIGGWGW